MIKLSRPPPLLYSLAYINPTFLMHALDPKLQYLEIS